MSLFLTIDLIARGMTLAMLLAWSWLLWREHRGALVARLALAMNGAIVCHVIGSIPQPARPMTVLDLLFDAGSVSVFGLFWLFTRAWFDDARQIGLKIWLIALAPTALIVWLDYGLLGKLPVPADFWFPLIRAMWFAFGIAALWTAWRGRDNDLIEERRRLRLRLVAVIGLLALLVNVVEIGVFRFGLDPAWRSITQFGIAIATCALCISMISLRTGGLFSLERPALSERPPVDDALVARLAAHMERDKPHRDEGLTIAALASQLGEQEYRLRRTINGALGHRNFAQFLNGYRLAEVKSALADPSQREVPIITIALDAGFGSLGPFNRAFREAEGLTPSEYRARHG